MKKKYTLLAIIMCFSLLTKAQTSSGKHHIKFLEINSGNPDIGVSFIDHNKVVFATTTSEKTIDHQKYNPHLDLFTGVMEDDGAIVNKQRMKGINSKRISTTGATFTKNGKKVYFSANKYAKRKTKKVRYEIYQASIDSVGNWYDIKKLPFNKKGYSNNYPAINKENTKLYFVSNRTPSYGGTDIFYVDINSDGSFGEPTNLGAKINTVGNETTPFIAENNFLYFSSDGREDSLGNMDVYASEAFENTVSEPLHLDSPVNSINDDIGYIVNTDNKGYFSSNRLQGQGNDDMYSFYIEPDKPEECLQNIVGTVRDKETETLITDAAITVIDDQGNEIKKLVTDQNGNYNFTLSCRNTYTVVASKLRYTKEEHIVNTANYFNAPALEINQSLIKEIKEVANNKLVINANPIYFGFDKSNITTAAKKELDKIVKIMKENPALNIESASHTDSRGSKAYNQKLSERRAKATVNYIVSKGISRDRITAKGYGESQLLNNCADGVRCGIEKHKLNRRTEFVIINKQALNIPKETKTKVVAKKEKAQNIITPKVTTAPPKGSVIEGTSNDSSKGEIIILTNDKGEEKADNDSESTRDEGAIEIDYEQKNDLVENTNNTTLTINKELEKVDDVAENTIEKAKVESVKDEAEVISETLTKNQERKEVETIDKIKVVENIAKTPANQSKEVKEIKENIQSEKFEIETPKKEEITLVSQEKNLSKFEEEKDIDKKIELFNQKEKDEEINKEKVLSEVSLAKEEPTQKIIASTSNEAEELIDDKAEIKAPTFNRDFSDDKDNISAVSNTLFSDTDDFESYDDKTITSTRFRSKVVSDSSGPSETKNLYLALKKEELKRQFIESTKDLKKEEVLTLNAIDVSPMLIKRNGNYSLTNTANRVDVMRINFQVNNNQHVSSGYKNVYVIIQNPKGTILNRKGTFKVNNGDMLAYTEKTQAYYNNNHLNLSMITDRFIQKVTKGFYTVIIYIEGYPIGLEMLELI